MMLTQPSTSEVLQRLLNNNQLDNVAKAEVSKIAHEVDLLQKTVNAAINCANIAFLESDPVLFRRPESTIEFSAAIAIILAMFTPTGHSLPKGFSELEAKIGRQELMSVMPLAFQLLKPKVEFCLWANRTIILRHGRFLSVSGVHFKRVMHIRMLDRNLPLPFDPFPGFSIVELGAINALHQAHILATTWQQHFAKKNGHALSSALAEINPAIIGLIPESAFLRTETAEKPLRELLFRLDTEIKTTAITA